MDKQLELLAKQGQKCKAIYKLSTGRRESLRTVDAWPNMDIATLRAQNAGVIRWVWGVLPLP